MSSNQHLESLIGKPIIADVAAPFVYLGVLEGFDDLFLILVDADVHDLRDSESTREIYVLSSSRDGIRRNRKRALLRIAEVMSISLLEDAMDH